VPEPRKYLVTYESSPGHITQWVKTLDELLMPNGTESLLDWMLRESDARGLSFEMIALEAPSS
jgi:hypothetical protein